MGFWKELFSNLDEPAIIIRTEKRIEIPIEEVQKLMGGNKKQLQGNKKKMVDYLDADYELLE